MNNSNIYIPKRINVGFQNRSGTYTGKLAYVIYYDEKGKLRKEASWTNWRDDNIPNEEYDNTPTEGFVLNKKVGGVEESWGYDPRRTYTRVYDPRGFEFEITIPNLLWILENCNCIKGKGLEGEFVYGWDNKDLILIPVDSPDYKVIQAKSEAINNNEFIKASDLVLGYTYQGKNTEKYYVYLGRHDCYKQEHNYLVHNDIYCFKDYNMDNCYYRHDDDDWLVDPFCTTKYRFKSSGKYYWFMEYDIKENGGRYSSLTQIKSVSNRFIKCISDCVDEKYNEYVDIMETSSSFSPIDYENVKIKELPYQTFENALTKMMNSYKSWYDDINFYSKNLDATKRYKHIPLCYYKYDTYNCYALNFKQGFYIRSYRGKSEYLGDILKDTTIRKIYDYIKPIYGIYYLKNGKEYKRIGWYEEDGTK